MSAVTGAVMTAGRKEQLTLNPLLVAPSKAGIVSKADILRMQLVIVGVVILDGDTQL